MANTRIGLLFAGPKTSVLMTNFTTLDPWFSLRRSSISTDTSGAKIPLFRIILLTFLLPANCGNFRGMTVRFFVTVYHQVHHNPEALVQITSVPRHRHYSSSISAYGQDVRGCDSNNCDNPPGATCTTILTLWIIPPSVRFLLISVTLSVYGIWHHFAKIAMSPGRVSAAWIVVVGLQ